MYIYMCMNTYTGNTGNKGIRIKEEEEEEEEERSLYNKEKDGI